jgi:hypothetical protein
LKGERVSDLHENWLATIANENLARTIDFVKYGETKNAALLAFSSTWLATVGALLLSTEHHFPLAVVVFLTCGETAFLITILISLAALLPLTRPEEILKHPRKAWYNLVQSPRSENSNLLFFGHISRFTETEHHIRFQERYAPVARRDVPPPI